MKNHLARCRTELHGRRGFTLIELIVTIGMISVLVSLLLPAIQQVRSAARRNQCMNHIRNIGLAVIANTDQNDRFPASGSFGQTGNHHNWVLDITPWLERQDIWERWDKNQPLSSPTNQPLSELHLAVLTCPSDISVSKKGDLSFVVNGGMGFTAFVNGVHDCPIDPENHILDLNGNGIGCPQNVTTDGKPSDRDYYVSTGMFFNETWNWNISPPRHQRTATILDGFSQTIMLTENVRSGYDPASPGANWASPNPMLTSFFIGNPCLNAVCSPGNVNYGLANAGDYAINSGLWKPEGGSPVPNSFHDGGVNMVFCDGHVRFISQLIDGGVYAALVSPQGSRLNGTPLMQNLATGDY
jgi:prepilin-type N-terminal cleavage/methylation domain-containing protein/prepilin-type processing-associated H-X9-DG protein